MVSWLVLITDIARYARISPSSIRWTKRNEKIPYAFCSHALMQGIDPRTVQKWMGHKDLKTTLGYAHLSPDHEKAAIQQLSYDHSHYMDTRAENGQ